MSTFTEFRVETPSDRAEVKAEPAEDDDPPAWPSLRPQSSAARYIAPVLRVPAAVCSFCPLVRSTPVSRARSKKRPRSDVEVQADREAREAAKTEVRAATRFDALVLRMTCEKCAGSAICAHGRHTIKCKDAEAVHLRGRRKRECKE